MATIRYEFSDGTAKEIEVDEGLFAVHTELTAMERRSDKRETRRHVSLSYLNEFGVEIEDSGKDPLSFFLRQEEAEATRKIFSVLSPTQRELLEAIYIDGKTKTEIARQKGVTQQAVSKQVATILRKLKKSF